MLKFFFLLSSMVVLSNTLSTKNQLLSIPILMMSLAMNFSFIWQDKMSFHLFFMNKFTFSLILLTLMINLIMMKNSTMSIMSNKTMNILFYFSSLFLCLFFSSDSMMMFYILYEVALIPIFILIMGWGYQPERITASMWMFMYTLIASLPLLGLMIFYMTNFSIMSFTSMEYWSSYNTPLTNYPLIINGGLVLTFLVKFPMYFFHLWLPRAHVEAPVSGSILLAAILLKMAGLGLMKFNPVLHAQNFFFLLKMFSLMGGAIVSIYCVFESDMKKLIAFTSVAHMSLVISAILTKSQLSNLGASLLILSHGLCSSMLFSGANQMYTTSNSRSMLFNSGILSASPTFTLFWFLACMTNMAGPPSLNFFSEVFCLLSLVQSSWISMIPLSFMIFMAAAYSMTLYSNTQYGRLASGYHLYSGDSLNLINSNLSQAILLFFLVLTL